MASTYSSPERNLGLNLLWYLAAAMNAAGVVVKAAGLLLGILAALAGTAITVLGTTYFLPGYGVFREDPVLLWGGIAAFGVVVMCGGCSLCNLCYRRLRGSR